MARLLDLVLNPSIVCGEVVGRWTPKAFRCLRPSGTWTPIERCGLLVMVRGWRLEASVGGWGWRLRMRG